MSKKGKSLETLEFELKDSDFSITCVATWVLSNDISTSSLSAKTADRIYTNHNWIKHRKKNSINFRIFSKHFLSSDFIFTEKLIFRFRECWFSSVESKYLSHSSTSIFEWDLFFRLNNINLIFINESFTRRVWEYINYFFYWSLSVAELTSDEHEVEFLDLIDDLQQVEFDFVEYTVKPLYSGHHLDWLEVLVSKIQEVSFIGIFTILLFSQSKLNKKINKSSTGKIVCFTAFESK